jgi:hypothetical protein
MPAQRKKYTDDPVKLSKAIGNRTRDLVVQCLNQLRHSVIYESDRLEAEWTCSDPKRG